jgi:integrase/recombinase XerD
VIGSAIFVLIMAKIGIIQWKYQPNADGTYGLYVRIYKNGRVKLISTGYSVLETDWDEKAREVLPSNKNYKRLNNLLRKLMLDSESVALDVETADFSSTTRQITNKIKGNGSDDYFAFAYSYIEEFNNKKNWGTYKTYLSKLKKIKEYLKNGNLTFNDIDNQFLRKYETHLKKIGNKVNSFEGDLKRIRSIYYAAIREGVAEQKKNPFFTYKLKTERTQKTLLTEEELNAIRNVKLKLGSLMWHSRNVFLLAFNFMGMRIRDLLLLRWDMISSDRVDYTMRKSRDIRSFALTPEAKLIIEGYRNLSKPDTIYVLPFFRDFKEEPTYKKIDSTIALTNKYHKMTAKLAGINKKVTNHVARHTWAQMAKNKKISVKDIQINYFALFNAA